MDALRTGISFISGYDEEIDNRSLAINKERAYRLLGTIPNIVANSYRILTKQRACSFQIKTYPIVQISII